ncbi:MAG: hypothetical protein RL210_256 [Pseudomonadota bacterium]|nr:hypothetical protein [Pseudomonadota bacterium]
MRIAPFNPPITPPERQDGLGGVSAVEPASAVASRALPPQLPVYRPLLQAQPAAASERRVLKDRRQVCLLRQPLPWLLEFRQHTDRRRRKRRRDDAAEHVDEQV